MQTTREKLRESLQTQIEGLQTKLASLEEVPGLDTITLDASFVSYSNQIDFDFLSHEQVIEVIKAIGGKWDKTPSIDASVDYVTSVGGTKIRCYQGKPPPNCKIVEVLEEIPAQPARTVTVRKLQCQ